MRQRTIVLVALALTLLLAFAGPAQAVVLRLHVNNGAQLNYGGIEVFGSGQCTEGQEATYRITARQGTGFGLATGGFTCGTGVAPFEVTVWPDTGYFTTGNARVRVSVATEDGDQRTVRKTVSVVSYVD